MSCRSCVSSNQREYGAEINIHLPYESGRDNPAVLVFQTLAVCLDCGFAGFTIAETEVRLLREGGSASTAA